MTANPSRAIASIAPPRKRGLCAIGNDLAPHATPRLRGGYSIDKTNPIATGCNRMQPDATGCNRVQREASGRTRETKPICSRGRWTWCRIGCSRMQQNATSQKTPSSPLAPTPGPAGRYAEQRCDNRGVCCIRLGGAAKNRRWRRTNAIGRVQHRALAGFGASGGA